MSISTEDGHITKHVCNNGVRSTTASQGTRDMARGNTATHLRDAERYSAAQPGDIIHTQINDLANEKRELVSELMGINSQLSMLNSEVKGRHVPQGRYDAIRAQQQPLQRRKLEVEKAIAENKARSANLQSQREKVRPESKTDETKAILKEIVAGIETTNQLLRMWIRIQERK